MPADLLLASFHYPPFQGVGARRWGFLSRFLAENGYSVAVATSPLSAGAEEAAAGQERLAVHVAPSLSQWSPPVPRLPFLREWLAYGPPFRRFLETLIARERPRLLVFTGGPFFTFILAPGLARRFRIPYWLDFRDAWALGSHAPLRCSAPLLGLLERRAVARARLVTDVTPEMSERRRAAFPNLPAERFRVLENGFDGQPGPFPLAATAPGAPLRLGIWGKFSAYDPRHPALLMSALARLAPAVPIEVHHFGDAGNEEALAAAAAGAGLAASLRFHGTCEYEAGLSALAAMDAMVASHRSPLMVGTKVYDAIRLNRPVLALCRPGDALARLLSPFPHAYRAATEAEASAALAEISRLRPGRLAPGLDPEPYSRRSQAQKFLPVVAAILARS